jgi:hypothetical protein
LIGVYGGRPSPLLSNPTFTPYRFADTTTPVPQSTSATTFSDFTRPTFGLSFTTGASAYFTGASASGQNVYRADWHGPNLTRFGQQGFSQATPPSAMAGVRAFGQGDDGVVSLIVHDEMQILTADSGFLGPPSVSSVGFNPPGGSTRVAYTARAEPTGPVNQVRVYRPELPTIEVQTVARFSTTIPGGTGTFTGFGDPAAGTDRVLFRGSGAGGQEGIYEYRLESPVGLFKLLDRNSPVPGRPGVAFTDFSDPALYQTSYLIEAALSDGNEALYTPLFVGNQFALTELISTGDVIDGKTIDAIEISREAIGGALNADYAFKATFTDGSEGIYLLKLPEPGTMTLLAAGIGLSALRRNGRRGTRLARLNRA